MYALFAIGRKVTKKITTFALMKTFRTWLLALGLALATLMASSCGVSRIKDISLQSVGVKYITPTSARSLDGVLILGIDNPAMSLNLSDIEGDVRYNDKPIAHFSAGQLPLEGKTTKEYALPCSVRLADGASLLDLLLIAARYPTEGLMADVKVHVALKKGPGMNLQFKDLDIQQFTQ